MIFNSPLACRASLVLAALPALATALPAQQQAPVETARRIADVAAIAVSEYAEGVRDGRVVQPPELEEARLFLAEARRAAEELGAGARATAVPLLEQLVQQAASLAPAAELERTLTALREALEGAAGELLDPMPAAAPSLTRGASLYRTWCAQCHGPDGAGDGPLAAGLDPPPPDLTDPALAAATPLEFFRKINVGVAGTAMPGFGQKLSLDDRWGLALYASTLRHPAAAPARGRERLAARCPECLVLLSGFETAARLNDAELESLLRARLGGAADGDMVAFARVAGALEELGGDRELETRRTVARVKELADEAVRRAAAGELAAARRHALDAYLAFERIELGVRARDPAAATRWERAFAAFRMALAADDAAGWRETRRQVDTALDGAVATLAAPVTAVSLFGQSFVIMLREGVEAILIIGALTAVLTRAGASDRKRDIGWGVLTALGASAVTAAAFATIFTTAAAHQELLEGLTMLAAAVVLFWVSYWLISKVEVRKWQQFVRSQVERALSSRRTLALAAVAFLAVYREGFETVLFYAALFTTASGPGAATGVVSGMLVGVAVLTGIYIGIEWYGVRLPLRAFFAVTSTLLYVMAFSFAGQGVAELQEAGLVSTTPLRWLPDVPALGIFPTVQTVSVQLALAFAFVAALLWLFWWQPRAERSTASA